jgi:hypothetical protein
MRTGLEVMEAKGMDVSQESWDGNDFARAGLPMVVACINCEMTMAFTSAMVLDDEVGTIRCRSCAPDGEV